MVSWAESRGVGKNKTQVRGAKVDATISHQGIRAEGGGHGVEEMAARGLGLCVAAAAGEAVPEAAVE